MSQENQGAEAQAEVATKVALTKEEKLAKIDAQIAKLQARRADIEAGKTPAPKAAKAPAYAPAIGDKVLATVGRTTATTQAKVVEGTVKAIRVPAEGEKGATQVRVVINEGTFDEQLVTLYVAQLAPVPVAEDSEAAAE